MANRFNWIRTAHHINLLRKLEKKVTVGESKVVKFQRLSALLREQVLEATEQENDTSISALPLSYAVIRQMAIRLNTDHNLIEGFKASKSWIASFVRECGLCSRRVTRSVTIRNIRQRKDVEVEAGSFVSRIREEMKRYHLSAFANADQTGINKEIVSKRTLAPCGSKQVMRSGAIHFITDALLPVPVMYADGRLGDNLLVMLSERGGVFPRCGHWQASNLLVMAGKSHIMTKSQVPSFVKECVVGSSSPPFTILLVDSWAGFTDHTNVLSEVPQGKELRLMTIPAGATALCQPLDVYFFGLFERYIRCIYDHVGHYHHGFTFGRDNILKVSSSYY
ncbi:hypothetical protein COOONC_05759 [Cooperia oncophora]